ncbi:hypothetical protein ACOSP7_011837 [Xanthoceras sorbifolium]
MSSESSSNSSEGSTSGSSLKSASSESKSIGSGDDPIESGNHPRSAGGPESSLPSGIIQGYNSEDYHRNNLEFSRFAVNRIRENRINNSRLSVFREEFSIPSDVGLRIPNMGEQVSNPEPGCVAIHPAFLEIGMCLPLQPYVRRFLREVGLAPAQLSPNSWRILIGMWCLWRLNGIDTDPTLSEIKHCYKLVGHARGGDGWWHLSSWTRLSGHSLIIGQPYSNKEWKKTWFVVTTGWGRELTIGGREQRVRSVFGFPGCDHRHIDYLLDVQVLASVNIIPEPSSLRLANSKRSFGKKKKLAGKSDKRKMPDKEVAPSRKRKSVASKRSQRTIPKGSLGAKIPEEFIKGVSSKRARVTTETSDQVLPEQEVLGDACAMPPVPPRGGKSKAGSTESVRGGDKRRRSRSPSAFHRPSMGSGVPPTFTSTRPNVSQCSIDAIFSSDQSVDFIYDNARNFMRSTDPGATGKMSNDDRIRVATGATDHIDSEGPPDNFDRRLIPDVRWVGHSDLFDRRLVSHDLLVVSIGGWSQRLDFVIFSIEVLDHFVRGFYLSVGYQCQHNFFDLRILGLWVLILRTSFVQVGEVYAHPPPVNLYTHNKNIATQLYNSIAPQQQSLISSRLSEIAPQQQSLVASSTLWFLQRTFTNGTLLFLSSLISRSRICTGSSSYVRSGRISILSRMMNVLHYQLYPKVATLFELILTALPLFQVLVVANPANTNALILKEFAPSIPEKTITCLTRLDHNRALGQISEKLNVQVSDVKNVIICVLTGHWYFIFRCQECDCVFYLIN